MWIVVPVPLLPVVPLVGTVVIGWMGELECGWNAAVIGGGVGDDGGGDGDMEDGTTDGGAEGSTENRVS